MRIFILFIFFFIQSPAFLQQSIHIEEAGKYSGLGFRSVSEYDSLNEFKMMEGSWESRASDLNKVVFGYHPYWGGSNYLNYQWDLLSDLCYFSYDVDPSTGQATSYYDWLISPAIDSALAHGTRVHLCVTLFSGHATFFGSQASKKVLTHQLISLVKQRNARGVSFDFEAVPSSQGPAMLEYVADFYEAFKDSIPDGILSIAMPSVDWNGIFDVSILNQYIDLYMIMGYDYYWNSSSMAGPVDPHYSMTYDYAYNVSRTVSYYQSEGMPMGKMLLGVPYYAREWPTASGIAPSAASGHGAAYTWAKIKNNSSGNYSPQNKHTEPNSFGPYYAYYDGGWSQCFVNDRQSFARRYKLVERRGLAGIGIWALGYDNGYSDLWQLIDEHFAQGEYIAVNDTLFDSGGPAWEYYDNEGYTQTIHGLKDGSIRLEFTDFNIETGYDSLFIYDGYYPGGTLLGGFTGSILPFEIFSSDVVSLRFKSDHATTASGWTAIMESIPVSVNEHGVSEMKWRVYPNPANDHMNLSFLSEKSDGILRIYSLSGSLMSERSIPSNNLNATFNISALSSGIYLIVFTSPEVQYQEKMIVR